MRVTCRGCTGMFRTEDCNQKECSHYCLRIWKWRMKKRWRVSQLRLRQNSAPLKEQRDGGAQSQ